jgi:hypothetical protein
MSQKLTKITLISALAISLSGCAQLSYLGDSVWGHTKNAWGYTKSAVNYVASPVTNLLRAAPQQQYVFEDATRAQNMAKRAFLLDGQSDKPDELFVPNLAQLPVPHTPKYQAPQYKARNYPAQNYAPRYQNDYRQAPVTPRRVVEAQPIPPTATPQVSKNVSFVKMGGGSNMQDWMACETQARGFIQIVKGGYIIDPAFESCMRAKGYKPENEVTDELSL